MNNSSSAQSVTFSFSNAAFSSVDKFTSSQTKNGASEGSVTVKNNSFTSSLDAQSVTTFVSAGDSTEVIRIFRDGDGKYAFEKAGIAAGQSDAVTPFIYLINGKRGCLPRMYGLRHPPQGIYIINGKIHVDVAAGMRGDYFQINSLRR
jgi:hypothetical protein